ncbi:thioredoxin [Clostridiales bacterium COT073_COT-073]|nr:thioredoxin [Clostridiales bacterium COT073_COT-073]
MALQFTDANFEQEVLKSDVPVLVDFYADWCGPCKMMSPVIDELAGEFAGKVKIGKLNVDESGETAKAYRVMSIPTMIVFVGGQPVDSVMGAVPKQKLVEKLNGVL